MALETNQIMRYKLSPYTFQKPPTSVRAYIYPYVPLYIDYVSLYIHYVPLCTPIPLYTLIYPMYPY